MTSEQFVLQDANRYRKRTPTEKRKVYDVICCPWPLSAELTGAYNWHLFSATEQTSSYFEIKSTKNLYCSAFSYMTQDNKTVHNFSLPLLNILINAQARAMPVKILDKQAAPCTIPCSGAQSKKYFLCSSPQSQQKHCQRQKHSISCLSWSTHQIQTWSSLGNWNAWK